MAADPPYAVSVKMEANMMVGTKREVIMISPILVLDDTAPEKYPA